MKEERKVTFIAPSKGFNGIVAKKKNRNDLCHCGSGIKSKKCCGSETKYYSRDKIETE